MQVCYFNRYFEFCLLTIDTQNNLNPCYTSELFPNCLFKSKWKTISCQNSLNLCTSVPTFFFQSKLFLRISYDATLFIHFDLLINVNVSIVIHPQPCSAYHFHHNLCAFKQNHVFRNLLKKE